MGPRQIPRGHRSWVCVVYFVVRRWSQSNSIQSLFPYQIYTNNKKHQNNKEKSIDEKTERPNDCPFLKRKKKSWAQHCGLRSAPQWSAPYVYLVASGGVLGSTHRATQYHRLRSDQQGQRQLSLWPQSCPQCDMIWYDFICTKSRP